MTTIVAFVEFILGFVPFLAIVLAAVFVLWAATKLFPRIDAWLESTMDRANGVDAEYDATYNTGYSSTTSYDQYI